MRSGNRTRLVGHALQFPEALQFLPFPRPPLLFSIPHCAHGGSCVVC